MKVYNLAKGKVLGLVNERVWLKRATTLDVRGTLTILTSLDADCPVVCDFTTETNTQWTFTDFVLECCLDGSLKQGDYFVVDNAPVHHGADTAWLLSEILEMFGVQIVFLPAYCPELNPCELVFSLIKSRLRHHHNDGNLLEEVLKALSFVEIEHVYSFYEHCIPKSSAS